MKRVYSLFVFIFLSMNLFAQSNNPEVNEFRYWIYFKDKGKFKHEDNIEKGSEAYNLAVSNLTERALMRRAKVLSEENIVSYDDLPLNEEYISKIKELGVKPHAYSRWMNAVSVKVKKDKLDGIKKLPFVSKIEGVQFLENVKSHESNKIPDNNFIQLEGYKFNYGLSFWQNEQIKVPQLHNLGVTGFGVMVGMCDDGFNWRNHEALSGRDVLGEYDWIFKDDSTLFQFSPNQQPGDIGDQDGHGTATMSTLGGFKDGKMIGPAFDVSFYLSKTEYGATETPVEEDYWLEAVEWMESKGVDVISSSLIYKPYDEPNNKYTYKDMDGKTTVIVRAADKCAYYGVVVCNSMGNERQTDPPSIVSPPDGDSVISVGAVDSTGRITFFSSNGPTSDGRIKPDIVAMGTDVWAASSVSFTNIPNPYSYTSGTSFSCPLTAGVCALILSAHPELTPMQVRDALRMTADKKDNPNNVYGWGLINSYDAVLYNGMFMSNKPEIEIKDGQSVITINVVSKENIDASSVKIFYSTSGNTASDFKNETMELKKKMNETNSETYSVTLPFDITKDLAKFYFASSDSQKAITQPFKAPEKFFFFNPDNKLVIY